MSQKQTPSRNSARRENQRSFHVAGFWRRGYGALIDCAILFATTFVAWLIVSTATSVSFPSSSSRNLDYWLDVFLSVHPALMGVSILLAVVATTYVFIFHIIVAKTPGMKLAGIRIIDIYGDPPSFARVMARTAGYALCLGSLGLGFIWIAFDHEKRGLHDWVSGTYAVKS